MERLKETNDISTYHYHTPFGNVRIAENGEGIVSIGFEPLKPLPYAHCVKRETPLIKEAKVQLMEYLNKERTIFSLPLDPRGTPFQKRVWKELSRIPYGETRTYKWIAEAIQSPKGFRAVGMANNKNPISIVIPCHRVIGCNGSLVGYAGGLDRKKRLLELEGLSIPAD